MDLFETQDQYLEFWSSFVESTARGDAILLGLCLMPNHWHAVVKEGSVPLGKVFQPMLTKFAMRSNAVNGRDGHVFQGRFKSYPLATTEKAKHVLRYIHKNPLRAKLVTDLTSWPWSSHNQYAGLSPETLPGLTIIMSEFSLDSAEARFKYIQFMSEAVPEKVRPDMLPDLLAIESNVERHSGLPSGSLRSKLRDSDACRERKRFIRLAEKAGVRAKDIAGFLGISASAVFYALRG